MTFTVKIKIWIIRLDYLLKNSFLKLFSHVPSDGASSKSLSKILIFRNGSLGDSVCAIPAITLIRQKYPNSEIILLTNSGGFQDISISRIIHPSLIDRTINYENIPNSTLVKQLRNEKIDYFVLLPQAHADFRKFIKDLLFAKYLRVKYITGFKLCVTRLFPKTQAKYLKIPNIRDFLLSIVTSDNSEIENKHSFGLNILKEDEDLVNEIFTRHSLIEKSRNIALTIGAKRPQNRWPLEYFDTLIEYLLQNKFNCILIGGKEDSIWVNQLKTQNRIIDFTGRFTVMQSAAALKNCFLHITNDTGPMHLSYAVGTFVIALFSSRDYPNLWYPPADKSIVFRNPNIYCSECFSDECNNNTCLREITPGLVIESLKLQLNIKA